MNDKTPLSQIIFKIYVAIFFAYMLLPLLIMGGAALNDSRFPSVYPWKGFTERCFVELWNDPRMWTSSLNTLLVPLGVVVMAVPIGTAAAILINNIKGNS